MQAVLQPWRSEAWWQLRPNAAVRYMVFFDISQAQGQCFALLIRRKGTFGLRARARRVRDCDWHDDCVGADNDQ
jgi:hypothetical protein